jgi:cellobiose-specific phosphotransferase system component IIB
MKGYERLLQLENHAGVEPTAGLSLDVVLLGPEVNYYVKHLVQNADGGFNQALEWIVEGAWGLAILRPIFTRTMDWMDWKLRSFHIVPHLQEL